MAFKFFHTADIHLDSPLSSLAMRNPELSELIGSVSRKVFIKIIDLCLEEKVQALLIAGDLYDGDQNSIPTALFLAEQIKRLDEAGIRTFIIRGNHDALSKITKELILPASVKIFQDKAETVVIAQEEGGVPIAIHGLSFKDSHIEESLLPKYKQPVQGAINIGMMHTSLNGTPNHDNYAPCSVIDLQNHGYNYWALGHIHKRMDESTQKCKIIMPGIPQGRSIKESGSKSITLVTITDEGSILVEEKMTSIAVFLPLEIDVTGESEWASLVAKIASVITGECVKKNYEHLILRLTLIGETLLAWKINKELGLLKIDIEFKIHNSFAKLWIEKIKTHCQVPQLETKEATNFKNTLPLTELQTILEQETLIAPHYKQVAEEMFDEISRALPQSCRNFLNEDNKPSESAAIFEQHLNSLSQEGAEVILSRLYASN